MTILLLLAITEVAALPGDLGMVTHDLGPLGRGTKPFRTGLVHSSGDLFLGTYGPQPALIWRYDTATGDLIKVGAPGEYQLDSMVEGPDGQIYIGTAYGGLVYRMDPATGEVVSLGSPPIESTSWIFTLILADDGNIYGAKGVGLFRLDPSDDSITPLGLVPGNHKTLGPNASMPIVRSLVQTPDGVIWGDTNRWLFRYHIESGEIEPVVDMAEVDPATYALFPVGGDLPTNDCWFGLYARFSGEEVSAPLWVVREGESEPQPVDVQGMEGRLIGKPIWWRDGSGTPVMIIPTWEEETGRSHFYTVDPEAGRVLWEWEKDFHEPQGFLIPDNEGDFYLFTFTRLARPDPQGRRLVVEVTNPTPAQCRCLAISDDRVLGTDTYDLGYAFTRDLETGEVRNHGKVWTDDHRCNYGPAAFAGHGRYFIANHSEAMAALWLTDVQTNRHWRIGESAIQLIGLDDGSVWGVQGPNPAGYAFAPDRHWIPSWRARRGRVFRYEPGADAVTTWEHLPELGPIAAHPDEPGAILGAAGKHLWSVSASGEATPLGEMERDVRGIVTGGGEAYLFMDDGTLARLDAVDGAEATTIATGFGPAGRGLFRLPRSGWIVGLSADGTVSICDPATGDTTRVQGPPPLPAGPAVDPVHDAWYFADDTVVRYELMAGGDYQSPGVVDRLPAMRDALASRMDFPLSWTSGSHQDFERWRAEARDKVMELLLPPPPEADFDPVVLAHEDRGEYVALKLALDLTGDSRVAAYMTVPKGEGPFPAVLLLHDHGARFDIGKEKMIRPLATDMGRLESAREWTDTLYGGRWLGDELARRGYVCFSTDALNWSERGGGGYEGQQSLASNLLHLGTSFAGLIAHEDLRAAEFLATRPEVDASRVAAMGLSMGAFRTWQVTALSDHIGAGVAICWMATVKGLMVPGNNMTVGQSAYSMLHPGLFLYMDYPDVASIACPKPLLVYAGEHDHLFPVPSVREAFDKMEQVWASQGAGDRLETRIWPVGHVFDLAMQDEAFAWLQEQLGEAD
ncbi:MAG: hypothetical protein GF320_07730 [Armatimonadia bacterium]|nr:hypothetical protein [Armatimonadia bacterium]